MGDQVTAPLTDDTVGSVQLVGLPDGSWRVRIALDNGLVYQKTDVYHSRAEAEAAVRALNFRGPMVSG